MNAIWIAVAAVSLLGLADWLCGLTDLLPGADDQLVTAT